MIFRSFVWSPIIYRLSSDHIAKGVGFIYKFVCCYMQSIEEVSRYHFHKNMTPRNGFVDLIRYPIYFSLSLDKMGK